MAITRLSDLLTALQHDNHPMRLVAAFANDAHTIEACYEAVKNNLVKVCLVGDEPSIREVCQSHQIPIESFEIIHEPNDQAAAMKAVDLINEGKADILMKGLVSTEKYMRAILHKERGLMAPKSILSHVAVIDNPNYHKLLIVGDVAVIPAPELPEKIAIANYLIDTAHALGIEKPRLAIIGAAETVSLRIPSSMDAAILSKMADRGQLKKAFVDGPLALDLAIDAESARIKKIESPVAGNADCLLFPNLETGNVFYKTNTKLMDVSVAAIVAGAKAPCILSSRGDTAQTKLYSIALAAMIAKNH